MGEVALADDESDALRTAAAAFSFDVAVLGCPTPFNIGGGLGVDFEPEGFEGVLGPLALPFVGGGDIE